MAEEGFLLGATALKQVEALIRRVQSQYWNPTQQRGRWQQHQPVAGCDRSYDLRLLWNPTSADLTIDVKYNSVTETISLTRLSEAADIKAAIDAHSEFVADDVHCTVDSAGPLWSSNALVLLPSGASIVAHGATMTRRNGSPTPEWRVDICSCVSA